MEGLPIAWFCSKHIILVTYQNPDSGSPQHHQQTLIFVKVKCCVKIFESMIEFYNIYIFMNIIICNAASNEKSEH